MLFLSSLICVPVIGRRKQSPPARQSPLSPRRRKARRLILRLLTILRRLPGGRLRQRLALLLLRGGGFPAQHQCNSQNKQGHADPLGGGYPQKDPPVRIPAEKLQHKADHSIADKIQPGGAPLPAGLTGVQAERAGQEEQAGRLDELDGRRGTPLGAEMAHCTSRPRAQKRRSSSPP